MTLVDPYPAYLTAGTTWSLMGNPGSTTQLVYATFNEDRRPLLPFVDTDLIYPGENNTQGDPSTLRYFSGIRFGGEGQLFVRALIDNTEVARGYAILSEDAYQASCFNLPKGVAGYGIRLQITGIAWWRYFYIDWAPVSEEGAREP